MSDPILTDIPTDGELFEPEVAKKDEQASEKPAESSAEESETEKSPSQEGEKSGTDSEESASANTSDDNKIPFNKHPRWKEMQEKFDRIERENNELREAFGGVVPKLEALESQRDELNRSKKVPKLFVDLYGDNAEHEYKEYKKELDEEIKKSQQEVLNKIEAEKRAEAEAAQRWNDWMSSSMKRVEEQFETSLPEGSSERNDFLKYVLKYKPTDDNGNIDFVLGFELWSQSKEIERSKKSEKNGGRKSLAATTTSTRGAEPKKEHSTNHKTLRNKSFLDLALESLNES